MHKWASELVSMCMCTTIYNTHDDKWYSRELQTIFVNLQYEVTLSKMNIWNKSIRIRLLSSKVRILQPIPFRVPLGIRQSDSFYSGFLQQKKMDCLNPKIRFRIRAQALNHINRTALRLTRFLSLCEFQLNDQRHHRVQVCALHCLYCNSKPKNCFNSNNNLVSREHYSIWIGNNDPFQLQPNLNAYQIT